jgi:hypothetical protein
MLHEAGQFSFVALESVLPLPKICVNPFLYCRRAVNLVKNKLFDKWLLNIPYNCSVDFWHLMNSLEKYGITMKLQ